MWGLFVSSVGFRFLTLLNSSQDFRCARSFVPILSVLRSCNTSLRFPAWARRSQTAKAWWHGWESRWPNHLRHEWKTRLRTSLSAASTQSLAASEFLPVYLRTATFG